ncbi:hypothetical protein [Paenibacillus sp. FSL R10-2734]|uniref:hypothetical protein n=1 Tax=Paenibacillus sp. FSL R10-2734 TaxID=2954691 RepID=UPI0030DA2688
MRDIERIPLVMNALKNCWDTMPDMRFGQLIENILSHYKGEENLASSLWNMEENEWLKAIQLFSEHHKGKWIYPPDEQ